jgi:small subunit ribosomal protein S18
MPRPQATCHNGRLAHPRAHEPARSERGTDNVAKQRSRPTRRREKKGGPGSGRRKSCPFCRDKIEQVDYKDAVGLRRFISDRGKIRSRRITGACRRHQNQIATAVKRARELALLPYVSDTPERERGGRGDRDRGDRDRDR